MATTTPMTEPTAFDTLTAANELREAGFDRKQAEALTRVVARAHGALATEAGQLRLEAKMDSRMGSLEARLGSLETRLDSLEAKVDSKADSTELAALGQRLDARIDSLEAKVDSRFAAFEVRMVRWLTVAVAAMFAAISLGFGLMGFLIAG